MNLLKLVNHSKLLKLGASLALLLFIVCQLSACRDSETSNEISPIAQSNNVTDESSQRGEQIVAEYLKQDAAPFRKSRLRFTVSSENEPSKVYELDVWRKQTENETLTLSQIVKPAEENDISSLANEKKGEDTVLTTYVSSADKFRQTGSNKAFFGGIPAQELLGEWSKFSYRLVSEKELNGLKTLEVEGKLNPSRDSVASQITALFRADNYLPVELHLFDSGGKELRTFYIRNYKTEGSRTYISDTDIENHIYKTRVRVEVLNISFPDKIEDSFFTPEKLKQIAKGK